MMLTSKQRSYLRGLANGLDALFRVGKSGVTPELIEGLNEALEARELIKISVLDNCEVEAKDAAETIAGRTRSDVVQVVGKKIVLYRRSKKPGIELPEVKARKG